MLHKIVESKREEVARLKANTDTFGLYQQAKQMAAPRGFSRALIESPRPVSVIAEIKKASPSKGLIRPDFDPEKLAGCYAAAGVEAMSVLTDEQYFQGSLEYLQRVRSVVDVPILRKDFIIDELQIVEARAYGADCILLIAAILDPHQLRDYAQVAESFGMDALVEVHDRAELEQVLGVIKPALLGINNRNLRTFDTTLKVTEELISAVPAGIPVVSESGISTPADIDFVHRAGARAVLVGEHFMRQADVTGAVIDLVGSKTGTSQESRQ
ncbi:indole-3-glycerol phosphate synthase TrpC [Brevibacillus massiliensis]|jgi:indole-3-glycerol phosphate synthase|uniref:indole-3-glycerol phosphate synthase TrpC n=1 Tax=Brevibacillus massiliensis TaxID=1118054 RepID=UPI000304D68A|nr:indole-3-glycerol phosphate synthase TrpC [Brevibacillus massiliensis]